MLFLQYEGVTVAPPLHPLVQTVNSKIRVCSGGSAQATARKCRRLRFPRAAGKELVQHLPERVLAAAAPGSSFAHTFGCILHSFQLRFAHAFRCVLHTLQLSSSHPFRWALHTLAAAAATEGAALPLFLLLHLLLRGHRHLHGHAVTFPGSRAIKVSRTKPAVCLLLCLFNEHRKLQARFSFTFMSSSSLSAVNIRPVSNNLCSFYVLIQKRLTWALFPRQPPPPSLYHGWCPHSIPWRRELLAGLGSASCTPPWEIPMCKWVLVQEHGPCSFCFSSCRRDDVESSVLIQRDVGAGSNYASMLKQAAALVGVF